MALDRPVGERANRSRIDESGMGSNQGGHVTFCAGVHRLQISIDLPLQCLAVGGIPGTRDGGWAERFGGWGLLVHAIALVAGGLTRRTHD